MILHRFMSEREFNDYQNGETMRNTTDHRKNGEHTKSVGFCFFTEDPNDAIHWLSGIVTDDVCVTFDVPDDKVTKSSGIYRDHEKSDDSWGALFEDMLAAMSGEEMPNVVKIERTEYCCTEYSDKDFLLLDYKYSERLLRHKRCNAEWERKPEELPEGVLLHGTTTEENILWASHKIGKALEKTPLCRGRITSEISDYGVFGSHITLPDGRIITPYQRVEVHSDGIVLIDGKLLAAGFPSLGFNTGTGDGDLCYYLQLRDGLRLEVTEALWKKYDEALRNHR